MEDKDDKHSGELHGYSSGSYERTPAWNQTFCWVNEPLDFGWRSEPDTELLGRSGLAVSCCRIQWVLRE